MAVRPTRALRLDHELQQLSVVHGHTAGRAHHSAVLTLTWQVALITALSAAIVVWNTLAGGFTDFDNVKHAALIEHLPVLSLPLSFFTLTGSSLGLLLVFRTVTPPGLERPPVDPARASGLAAASLLSQSLLSRVPISISISISLNLSQSLLSSAPQI